MRRTKQTKDDLDPEEELSKPSRKRSIAPEYPPQRSQRLSSPVPVIYYVPKKRPRRKLPNYTQKEERLRRGCSHSSAANITDPHADNCEPNGETSFIPEKIPLSRNILYRFRCPSSGTFRCSSTDLVFVVTEEAELQYRIVQWDQAWLHSSGRTPAGPLYDIECPERAVCELHLPHCEAESVDISKSQLSVAHLSDSDSKAEFIEPIQITNSHVVIEVSKLSLHGLTAPSEPNRAISGQVLLFRTPRSWDVIVMNIILLPRNIPPEQVKCRQLSATCIIGTPYLCRLVVEQYYSVLCPSAELIQPEKAQFDLDFEPNYYPQFELRLSKETTKASVTIQEAENSEGRTVLKREVSLTDPTRRVPRTHPRRRLVRELQLIHPRFVENVSEQVLDQLLDRLLTKRYLNAEEVDTARQKPRAEKARAVLGSVRKKGSRAAEYFIKKYCELDRRSDLSSRMKKILRGK